jgi:hypothetical protein
VPLPFLLYTAWNEQRQTRKFLALKQRTAGVITHLWAEPPSGSGKRYYAGFRYGQEQAAYQQVRVQTYKKLALGAALEVDSVPGESKLVRAALDEAAPGRRSAPTR